MSKKVLFVLNNLEGGGAEKMMVKIINGFVANGIAVDLLLGKKTGIHLDGLNKNVAVAEAGGSSFFDYYKYLPKILKANSYTHIFTIGYNISSAALAAKKFLKTNTKIYSTHHFAYPAKRELKYWKGDLLLKFLYYTTFPSADKIIAVSKGSLEWLRKYSNRKLPQGVVIYNPAVDDDIKIKSTEALHLPPGISGKKILLTIGRLNNEKDHFTLIDAFAIYKKKYPTTVLFILGEGPLEDELKKYIASNSLQQDIYLKGFQKNPYNWLSKCDAFVLSSKFEGFGNVLAEAMSLGKTIVSTDCPVGPSEILEGGKLGYLCPVQHPTAMADAIEKAITNPFDSTMLIKASMRFHENVAIEKYLDTLKS